LRENVASDIDGLRWRTLPSAGPSPLAQPVLYVTERCVVNREIKSVGNTATRNLSAVRVKNRR
jgi:hypothetical protein